LITAGCIPLFDNLQGFLAVKAAISHQSGQFPVKNTSAKSFRRDILEVYPILPHLFIDLERRDTRPLSPLEGTFYVGISKTDPLFS
jgi:hypothetical protein